MAFPADIMLTLFVHHVMLLLVLEQLFLHHVCVYTSPFLKTCPFFYFWHCLLCMYR